MSSQIPKCSSLYNREISSLEDLGFNTTFGSKDFLFVNSNDPNASYPRKVVEDLDALKKLDGYTVPQTYDEVAGLLGKTGRACLVGDEGPVFVRNSIFSDSCLQGESDSYRTIPMTETMAQAIALQTGRVFDEEWCLQDVAGMSFDVNGDLLLKTPFYQNNPSSLVEIRQAIENIEAIRAQMIDENNPENVRIHSIPQADIDSLKDKLNHYDELYLSLSDTIKNKFSSESWTSLVLHLLAGGTVITTHAAVTFHYVTKLAQGVDFLFGITVGHKIKRAVLLYLLGKLGKDIADKTENDDDNDDDSQGGGKVAEDVKVAEPQPEEASPQLETEAAQILPSSITTDLAIQTADWIQKNPHLASAGVALTTTLYALMSATPQTAVAAYAMSFADMIDSEMNQGSEMPEMI